MSQPIANGWRKVIFSSDCDEDGNCPRCGIDYADCGCPGPTQDELYQYREINGVLYARRIPRRRVRNSRIENATP